MTIIHKEDAATDVDAVQIWSIKELEGEFVPMLKAYHDKETEFNWEAREKSITRLRGILRGNAIEPPYLEVLVQCMKQMVDGIIKGVESLRTQLAVKALLLIEDIGIFLNKHIDNYTTDQILQCMMRCASLTKKMVASASFKATHIFLKHTSLYPKVFNMLNFAMAEKNSQVRLYAVGYTKTVLQTHAHRDHTRTVMDRTSGTMDHLESILTKGLNDPTPAVKEACREAFWIFWEYWRERGDHILRQLPAIAQKQLEKSKNMTSKQAPMPTSSKSLHHHSSPISSPRASSSLGRHQQVHHNTDLAISPSTSTTSNGSNSSPFPVAVDPINKQRSMSPSPHLKSYGSPPPPTSVSSSHYVSQQQQQQQQPSTSTSPTSPTSNLRKTRVPTPLLNRKKSAVGLVKRKQPNFMTLLNSEDVTMRADGFLQLAKKLAVFPYTPIINLQVISLDIPHAPPVEGDTLKQLVLQQWDEQYEVLSTWDSITNVLLKLLTFEECLPKLILDAHMDDSTRRTEADIAKYGFANVALVRAKLFLQFEHPDLVDILFTSLVQYGGFVKSSSTSSSFSSKKDLTKLPANRRKLTKEFLEWMDELVLPLIGLEEDVDFSQMAYEGVPDHFTTAPVERSCSAWFESDDNVRQCLAILLPLITTSTSGSIWHVPLVNFIKHIRLLNQRLFEMVTATYDDYSINKICRVLGIHIRIEPPATVVAPVLPSEVVVEPEQEEEVAVEENGMAVEEVEEEEEEEEMPVENIEEEVEPIQVEMEQPIMDDEPIYPPTSEEEQEPIQENAAVAAAAGMVTATSAVAVSQQEEEAEPIALIQPLKQLSIQERNEILDHDITPTATDYTEKALPPLKQQQEEQEHQQTDYFSSKDQVQHDLVVKQQQQEKALPSEPNDYLEYDGHHQHQHPLQYANHHDRSELEHEERTIPAVTSSSSTSTATGAPTTITTTAQPPSQQPQQPQVPVLPCSIPNPEKYPIPTHVPFFAPERVNFPNPIFHSPSRTLTTSNSTTTTSSITTNRNPKDKTVLLYNLIDKLKSNTGADHYNTFKKLIKLAKEVPIRRRWDQGGIEESGSETWAGANPADAGNFVELVQAILFYLDQQQQQQQGEEQDAATRCLPVALECTRQLAMTQVGLFRFYERKVDDKGMTLESQLLEKLLSIRSNENPTVCIAAEDALDAVLGTLNPPTCFEMLMAFIIHRLLILPASASSAEETNSEVYVRYDPVGSAFMYLNKWVKEMNDTFYIDEWLAKGGVNAFFKGLNHSRINIRKSCVEAIVSFHEVIGDDIYLFLVDLREDQLNLLRHYVSKSLKKKASLRNLRGGDNNNINNSNGGSVIGGSQY